MYYTTVRMILVYEVYTRSCRISIINSSGDVTSNGIHTGRVSGGRIRRRSGRSSGISSSGRENNYTAVEVLIAKQGRSVK